MPLDMPTKQKIQAALTERGALQPCARCGHKAFELVDGYFTQPVQNDLGGAFMLGGPSLPLVAVICVRCGNVNFHALGVLGLMSPPPAPAPSGSAVPK